MNYPGYLQNRLAQGYPCQKDLESVKVSKKTLSLVGIEQISLWILEGDYRPSLKNKAINLTAAGIVICKVLQGGSLPAPPRLEFSPPTHEWVVENKAILVRNSPDQSGSVPGRSSRGGSPKSGMGKGPRGKSTGWADGFMNLSSYRFRRPTSVQQQQRQPAPRNPGKGKANPGNGGGNPEFDDQCPAQKKEQSQESKTFDYDLTSKSKKKKKQSQLDELAKPDLPLEAKQKLLENTQLFELSIDPRTGQIDKQSFDEAESILQTQRKTGLFDNARRPNTKKGERDIDFILSGSLYDEADIKTPKSFFDTRKVLKNLFHKIC